MNQWNPDLYDSKHAFVWQAVSSLVELLAPQAGERILDLGCGTGALTAKIAESEAIVFGMDQSSDMVAKAQKEFPALPFTVGDARNFSFEEPFDAVFSNAVHHWIPEADDVAACVARALVPGGRFVIEFGGKGNVKVVSAAAEHAAEQILEEPRPHPWYFPSIAEYSSVLENHGLEVTHAALFDRPTPLEGTEGLRNWYRMFGGHWLTEIPEDRHEEFFRLAEFHARSHLLAEEGWFADYRRLRVVARKLK